MVLRLGPVFGACALLACGARSELRVGDAALGDISDATVDTAPPECRVAADCDDRIACTVDRCVAGRCVREAQDARCADALQCNGVERCDPTAGCVPGPAFPCDDGVACTVDRCDEGPARCASTTDDARCPISHRCDRVRGCVARALAVTSTNLYEVELPSANLRAIGRVRAFTDVALHPDRTLYGINGIGELWRIDPTSALSSFVLNTGVSLTALDAAADGTLFAAGPGGLYRIDLPSPTPTFLAPFPAGLEASGDVAILEGRLLATARSGAGALDVLVEFDPRGGTARVLGDVGFTCVYALAAFGRTLYGMSCGGDVLEIDAMTGAGRRLSRSTVVFYGATAR